MKLFSSSSEHDSITLLLARSIHEYDQIPDDSSADEMPDIMKVGTFGTG